MSSNTSSLERCFGGLFDVLRESGENGYVVTGEDVAGLREIVTVEGMRIDVGTVYRNEIAVDRLTILSDRRTMGLMGILVWAHLFAPAGGRIVISGGGSGAVWEIFIDTSRSSFVSGMLGGYSLVASELRFLRSSVPRWPLAGCRLEDAPCFFLTEESSDSAAPERDRLDLSLSGRRRLAISGSGPALFDFGKLLIDIGMDDQGSAEVDLESVLGNGGVGAYSAELRLVFPGGEMYE